MNGKCTKNANNTIDLKVCDHLNNHIKDGIKIKTNSSNDDHVRWFEKYYLLIAPFPNYEENW